MNLPQLLILGTSVDLHIDYVLDRLSPSISYCRLDIDELPRLVDINFRIDSDQSIRISKQGSTWDLSSVTAVWFRRIGAPTISPQITNRDMRTFAAVETESALINLVHLLERATWISPYQNVKRATSKIFQLLEAGKAGLKCPKTLVTNNPVDARNFVESFPKVVYKTLFSPTVGSGSDRLMIYTSLVSKNNYEALNQVRHCPCQFQEYVEKAYELRITLTGTEFHAVKINSQDSYEGTIDWRQGMNGKLKYERYELPRDLVTSLSKFVNSIGLVYGAIDMIVTPDNEYVFLEINPHGAWGWLERDLGIEISQSLATYIESQI